MILEYIYLAGFNSGTKCKVSDNNKIKNKNFLNYYIYIRILLNHYEYLHF